MTVALRPGLADQVLLDDVEQQGGFSGAGHAKAVGLHNPHFVRPSHRFFADVIADHDGVVGEGLTQVLAVPLAVDGQWWVRPGVLPFGREREQ